MIPGELATSTDSLGSNLWSNPGTLVPGKSHGHIFPGDVLLVITEVVYSNRDQDTWCFVASKLGWGWINVINVRKL